MWWLLFPRWIWFFAGQSVFLWPDQQVIAISVSRLANAHSGICPNEINPNLWVDAMSTCLRECESDQECERFEKCCPNVCGKQSCVAARYMGSSRKVSPVGLPKEAICANFVCTQQGSECDVWEGQPVCKCRDRCEREPHFTCASDGMTYYNKCYMDAEACSKGNSISVVTCSFHLTWPNTSPLLPLETTHFPTTAPPPKTPTPPTDPQPPVMASSPSQQLINAGDTASFLCVVTGSPRPEISWQKQQREQDETEKVVMRPNHVMGNVVVTNIGQLVIYNARLQDSGIYTCTASNPSGSAQVHHALTVVPVEPPRGEQPRNTTRCSAAECQKPPDTAEDCVGEESVSWYYEPQRNSCFSFTHAGCHGNAYRKPLETYEECMSCCGPEVSAPCSLPSLQGPCKAYEHRWAYSSSLRQCQSFIYGGCSGNANNFESREACEEMCPYPKDQHCRTCKPRGKMVTSFCGSDFVILGRLSGLKEETDSGNALVSVEEVLKDDKMGLRFFGKELLEVTFLNMDWNCPCPNISEGQVIVMGDVRDGIAVLQPDSYMAASTPRRVRKLREVISRKTCDILKVFPTTQ
ncbi:WAP, Kazal, immunoglobulin, Kunitz and NTR domain-containing protein 2 [Esox lucius]|uniref:WAP, follistatin/kazal, immunoglobulin, kunitz and netrin domain containing 2b n=1 Tax=Esox lucius TaxID=8010 RepID=A0A3P9AHE0_ESOLU|nr:WAP, Kazal, immunoglobulin, Kunitz and NTR domain-containing protein 2 [Esox lucius]